MKKGIITFCLSVLAFSLFAQVQSEDLIKYKKKYPERIRVKIKDVTEINISVNKGDSLDIVSSFYTENIYLDKHANNFAERSVTSNYFRKISDIEAKTLLPVNETKYKTLKVKEFKEKSVLDNMIFFDDSKHITFTYPSMREGAKQVLEYNSTTITPQLMQGCYFGDATNTEYQAFKLVHPSSVKVRIHLFNGVDTLVNYKKEELKGLVTHSWVVKNLEPLEMEGGSQGIEWRIPHVYPVIESYTTSKGKEVPVLRDLDDLHSWYTDLFNQSGVKESEELNHLVDSLTNGLSDENQKVEAIYEWVQKNVKYVAYEDGLGGFIPRPPQLVFERKYGDCKDMAYLQVQMLQQAGVKTSYVGWVGTRAKPYKYEELASPGCDNHMIATYKGENGWLFLDATGTYTPYGYPSSFIQGKEVLVHLDDENYKVVEVEELSASKNLSKDKVVLRLEGDKLVGEGRATFTGYILSNLKYKVLDTDSLKRSKVFKSRLEKGNNKFFFTLKTYDFSLPATGNVDYSFEIEDYVNKSGDEVYLNMNLEKLLSNEKIDDVRKTPYESDYEMKFENVFEFDMEGKYKASFLPENDSYKSDKFSYDVRYELKGTKIVYHLTINLSHLVLEVGDFDEWNKMVKKLNKKYKEVVILKAN